MKKRCVFIDRDGTINREVNYLHKIEDLEILPGVAEGIEKLNKSGFTVIILTNQSGIARGYYGIDDMNNINNEIIRRLEKNEAKIDAIYFCPHHPNGKVSEFTKKCNCRKPEPGLYLEAANDFDIDFKNSYAIGDKIRDLEPAKKLGGRGILVKTGHGKKELQEKEKWGVTPDYIADDLLEAVQWLLEIQ